MISRKIVKIVQVPLTIFTLWMLLFGPLQFSVDMSAMDGKARCPFGGHSMAICQANPIEHIQEWKSIFTTLPAKNVLLILFTLLALFAIQKFRFRNRFLTLEASLLLFSTRSLAINSLGIIHPLKEVFSRGILNPKLY